MMTPQTPKQVTPHTPRNGVIAALDEIWHREGPLTAADLRTLTTVSQSVSDLYDALDRLSMLNTEEVDELENQTPAAQDPAKAPRIVQARQALARFDDLTVERIDPESIDVARLDDIVDDAAARKGPRP